MPWSSKGHSSLLQGHLKVECAHGQSDIGDTYHMGRNKGYSSASREVQRDSHYFKVIWRSLIGVLLRYFKVI